MSELKSWPSFAEWTPANLDIELIDIGTSTEILGEKKTTFYLGIGQGTRPRQIKAGTSSRWPRHEILAISAAKLAEASVEQQRELVRELHALRSKIFAKWRAAVTAAAL